MASSNTSRDEDGTGEVTELTLEVYERAADGEVKPVRLRVRLPRKIRLASGPRVKGVSMGAFDDSGRKLRRTVARIRKYFVYRKHVSRRSDGTFDKTVRLSMPSAAMWTLVSVVCSVLVSPEPLGKLISVVWQAVSK